MHRKTLEELDYYRIRDEISGFCSSSETREIFLRKEPLTDREQVDFLKTLGRQWNLILDNSRDNPVSGWEPVHSFLPFLNIEDSSLGVSELFAIMQFARSAIKASVQIKAASKTLQIKKLAQEAEKLNVKALNAVESALGRVIDAGGNIKDIPEIRKIRTRISEIKSEIESALKKYTSDVTLNSVLETNVPAFRADRQVLAVRANMKNRINGIVHEVSQSGQTLYIEPEEVVRKNNELIQEEYNLNAEIKKILRNLTAEISPFCKDLKDALFTMELLDSTCAAAKWGRNNRCTYALDCTENQPPLLIQARHPLLGDKAVPVDMKFMDNKNVLIITGPNTGGKTVTLKTFALLSLLNQSGFPVPAAEGTRLRHFTQIFADIGDEQSIDQSLSTFSAHMKNIAAAAKHADENSLVLLDELGSGTDPQEGGAIAMAVLDELIQRKSFVLVTTHHGLLKNYGYSNEYCINASVDFDSDTLSPTYRLQMGIPGESHALDIAKRSGLPAKITDRARSMLAGEQADVSSLIKGLTKKHEELSELEEQIKDTARRQHEKKLKYDQREIDLRKRELEINEREHLSESRFLSETRKELENLVRIIREGEITREKTLAVKDFISSLTEGIAAHEKEAEREKASLAELQKKLDEEKYSDEPVVLENGMIIVRESTGHSSSKKNTKKRKSNKEALMQAGTTYSDEQLEKLSRKYKAKEILLEFVPGSRVLLPDGKTQGELLSRDGKNTWQVQVGSLKMSFKEKELTLTAPPAGSKVTYTVEFASKDKTDTKPIFELRLLGMREEEAIKALSRQLDLCTIHNFKNFSIIHGKGNGILQQSVHDYLSNYPGVRDFHFAHPEDGGTGKTYVELV